MAEREVVSIIGWAVVGTLIGVIFLIIFWLCTKWVKKGKGKQARSNSTASGSSRISLFGEATQGTNADIEIGNITFYRWSTLSVPSESIKPTTGGLVCTDNKEDHVLHDESMQSAVLEQQLGFSTKCDERQPYEVSQNHVGLRTVPSMRHYGGYNSFLSVANNLNAGMIDNVGRNGATQQAK